MAQPIFYGRLVNQAMVKFVTRWLDPLQSWLQDSITSARLSAAGLNPWRILQTLHNTLTVAERLRDQHSGGVARGPCTDVQQQYNQSSAASTSADAVGIEASQLHRQLHALGVLVSSLPISWGCNNPVCTNMQGPAEVGIVQGKGHKCKGCNTAHYCGKACQAQDCKQHKPMCRAIAAAGASAYDAAFKL
jgi:hypothetical protein